MRKGKAEWLENVKEGKRREGQKRQRLKGGMEGRGRKGERVKEGKEREEWEER